jgi:phosphoribosylformylglycinamidine (FGAM) synthase-like enzyme
MYTAISSSSMFNSNLNESQERFTSEEREKIPTMKALNAQQKLKAKKIGSIISMKALKNDILGVAASMNAFQ